MLIAIDRLYNATASTNKCKIKPALTMTCLQGAAVNRIVAGVPICEPIVTGVWGPFGACPTTCGSAIQTRTCLIGSCSGPATQTCAYYSPPVMSCGFHLVDRIGDPPGTCGGGGGDMIFCSSTTCPPAGVRFSWSSGCDGRYHGSSSGPSW